MLFLFVLKGGYVYIFFCIFLFMFVFSTSILGMFMFGKGLLYKGRLLEFPRPRAIKRLYHTQSHIQCIHDIVRDEREII